MLIAKQGESGPRIVALQILLNRHKAGGKVLKVDGQYGKKTAESVVKFREEVMYTSGRGDVVEAPVWQVLLNRASLQVVDAVDVSDPMVLELVVPAVSDWTNPIEIGGMSNGVEQVVQEIKARAAGGSSILLLRFHGHGGPGLAAISHGKRSLFPGVNPVKELTVLNQQTVAALRPVLAKVAPLLCDFGFVELHACKVAQGVGVSLLRDLAAIWQVPVTASTQSQSAEGKNNFILSGPLVTAYPGNVDLRTWASTRKEAQGIKPT